MNIKNTHSKSFYFFGACILIVALLLSIKGFTVKESMYVEPPQVLKKTNLDFLQITFNEEQFEKINKKRKIALSLGTLETSDSDYVPALVSFNGENYEAQVRLKGDWVDHIEGEKWSFRVKLKGDKTILGMRKFSIHHPKTRGNIDEWLYHKAIKQEGVIGLRYDFIESNIHIKLSGSDEYITKEVGFYAIEETFDKRTIESNQRKESVILKFSEDYWWNEVKRSTETGASYNKRWNSFLNPQLAIIQNSPITTFSEEKVMADSTLRGYFIQGKNMLEDLRSKKTTIDKVFDIDKLAMQSAILNLFGAVHGTYSINLRFYYNPITSKLEPIAFDGNSGVKLNKYTHFIFMKEEKDSIYLKALAKALSKVSQETFVDQLVKEHLSTIEYYTTELKTEFPGKLFHEENLRTNQKKLKQELLRIRSKYKLEDVKMTVNEPIN